MDYLSVLADPMLVAKFQKIFGVELVKPDTCDQQTQTHKPDNEKKQQNSSDSRNGITKYVHGTNPMSKIDHLESYLNGSLDNIRSSENGSMISESESHDASLRPKILYSTSDTNSKVVTDNDTLDLFAFMSHNDENKCLNDTITTDTISRQKFTESRNTKNDVKSRLNNNTVFSGKDSNRPDLRAKNSKISSCVDDFCDQQCTSKLMSTPVPKQTFRIKHKSLFYLAQFGAFLGNEEFYLTFFPFCIWNLDCLIVRQVSMLWCLVMYLGQATKDYLRWPRPPCPPVIRLETHYLQEYSMPSTHAMAGTAIPLYLAYLSVERYQVPVPIGVTVAILWFSITCFSRLYLGVHSVLDLLAGFVYAIFIFFTFLRYVEAWDHYLQTNQFAGFVLLATALALCTVCYPSVYQKTSKGDAVQIVGAVAGCQLGCWIGCQMGIMMEPTLKKPYFVVAPTMAWCVVAVLRFVTGVLVLAATHFVVRLASIRLFSFLNGLDAPDKTNSSVNTAYKFTTYIIVGTTISLGIPLIHSYFEIVRPSVFYEVV